MIYLDNAATTFPKPEEVYQRMDEINRTCGVNAGRGSYKLARQANEIIDDIKQRLLKLVDASSTAKVVLTPSITIALNQILNGIEWKKGDVVYISPYEHNAVARTLEKIKNEWQIVVKLLPLNMESYEIDLNSIENLFVIDKPKCVCCTGVSNVTGYILPTRNIFELAKEVGAITILDSAQSLGLIKQDMKNIDYLAFAGHKTLYGPFGIGGFIDNTTIELKPYIVGGTGSNSLDLSMPKDSPARFESASANIVAIAGFQAALMNLNVDENYHKEKKLTEYAVSQISNVMNIRLYIPKEHERIGIVSFNIKNSGMTADDVGKILDEEYDIYVRSGYHCAPYIHDVIQDKEYSGTVRIGIGQFNTMEEIDQLCEALEEIG
mgnify:CR=1 FL=1